MPAFILVFGVAQRETVHQMVETQCHKEAMPRSSRESTKCVTDDHPFLVEIIFLSNEDFTVQTSIPYVDVMLKSEALVQKQLNEIGIKARHEVLVRLDRDDSPIQYGLPMAA